MKKFLTILATLIFSIFLIKCGDDRDSNPGQDIEIEWIREGKTIEYVYEKGFLSGLIFFTRFKVVDGSGELPFRFFKEDDDSKTISETFTVSKGKQYTVKAVTELGNIQNSYKRTTECFSVVFKSSKYSITIPINSTLDSSIDPVTGQPTSTWRCPNDINSFEELSIEEGISTD